MVERVRTITDRLVSEAVLYRPSTSSWNWTVNVIDEPNTINAFCMDGGKMAVYTGLLEKLQPTDDELAQVMGHEISHALAGHNAEKVSVKLASEIVVPAITAAGNARNQRTRHDSAELAAQMFVNLPHSRLEEAEADKMGIELAAKAGYHPHAAVTLWQKMIRQSGDSSRFDFFNDHPAPPERLETLAALEPSMLPIWANSITAKAPETKSTNVAGGSEPVANRNLTYVRPSSPETGAARSSETHWSHVGIPIASAMQAPEQAATQAGRVGAAPNVVGLKEESKYMVSAASLAQSEGLRAAKYGHDRERRRSRVVYCRMSERFHARRPVWFRWLPNLAIGPVERNCYLVLCGVLRGVPLTAMSRPKGNCPDTHYWPRSSYSTRHVK